MTLMHRVSGRHQVGTPSGGVNCEHDHHVDAALDHSEGGGDGHCPGHGSGDDDFEAGPNSLTDAFPLEGTIPVLCGGIAN